MFSGIIEEVGTVAAIETLADSIVIFINAPQVTKDTAKGASISVNGVCLTVVDFTADTFHVDVMAESLNRSNLGELKRGDRVNLERALKVAGRLDGHIVQGHVDATTTLISRTTSEHWETLRIALPAELARYVVHKGSIAVNGVSLTVSKLSDDYFEVSLIPTTLAQTTFDQVETGALLNLEVDVLGKYVERILSFN